MALESFPLVLHRIEQSRGCRPARRQEPSRTMENVRDASLRLLQHPLSHEQRQAIFQFEREVTDHVAENNPYEPRPAELSDLEAEIPSAGRAQGKRAVEDCPLLSRKQTADPQKMDAFCRHYW